MTEPSKIAEENSRDEQMMSREAVEKMNTNFQIAMAEAGYVSPLAGVDDPLADEIKPQITLFVCRICHEAIEAELMEKEKEPKTMKDIVARVARRYGVTVMEIRGQRKHKGIVKARHEAFWLIRQILDHLSYPQIGNYFGGRDHTTIMYGVKKHQARLNLDKAIEKVQGE